MSSQKNDCKNGELCGIYTPNVRYQSFAKVNTNVKNCLTQTTVVNVVNSGGNKYVFNGGSVYDANIKYKLGKGTYIFKNIPIGHPLAILNSGNTKITYTGDAGKRFRKAVTGTTSDGTYDFYYGDITVSVSGDFGIVSVYCFYHGYMGGLNLLKFNSLCEHKTSCAAKGGDCKMMRIGGVMRRAR